MTIFLSGSKCSQTGYHKNTYVAIGIKNKLGCSTTEVHHLKKQKSHEMYGVVTICENEEFVFDSKDAEVEVKNLLPKYDKVMLVKLVDVYSGELNSVIGKA